MNANTECKPQTLPRLLDGLLLQYPVDPAQRDALWRGIAAALSPPAAPTMRQLPDESDFSS